MTLRLVKEHLHYVVVISVATVLAVGLLPHIHIDDAAISFRYVKRLSAGQGLTFNDHEHIFGASNPLYILILFVLHRAGMEIENAAYVLSVVLSIFAVFLATYLATKLSNWIGGLIAGLTLSLDLFFLGQASSGMESILSVVLGLLFLVALYHREYEFSGIALGLAIWNKLDAGLLALSVLIVWVLMYRKIPWKIILISFLVLLPWLTFATLYYGTPLPNSIVTKLFIHGATVAFNHLWLIDFMRSNFSYYLLFAMSLSFFLLSKEKDENSRIISFTMIGWFIVHAIAFTFLNLGDYYLWYLTVLIPPMTILASAFFGDIVSRFTNRTKPLILVAILIAIYVSYKNIGIAYQEIHDGNSIKTWEAFDNDRRLVGVFLSQYADSEEVVQSAYGWIAYEIPNPFNDRSLLNSKVMRQPVAYAIEHGNAPYAVGYNAPPKMGGDFVPIAMCNLTSDLFPGYTWFTIYGRSDSRIVRSQKCFLQYRLFELLPMFSFSADYELTNARNNGADLFAHPPCGAVFSIQNRHQPVHIVFMPSFGPGIPTGKGDGVTFQLYANDSMVYQRHVLPTETLKPVIQSIPNANRFDSVKIAFVTTPGPKGDMDFDWAIWKNVKIVIGDAYVDVNRMHDKNLIEAWKTYNPVAE